MERPTVFAKVVERPNQFEMEAKEAKVCTFGSNAKTITNKVNGIQS